MPSCAMPGSTCSRRSTPRARRTATSWPAFRRCGFRHDDTWSDIFSRILVGRGGAQSRQWPHHGALRISRRARRHWPAPCARDPRVAERFELYACGVELANGFGELTDPEEQRRRFEAEMDVKERIYGERYPIDEELLEALAMMPPASGRGAGASTGWSCWRRAPRASTRCCGRRSPETPSRPEPGSQLRSARIAWEGIT